MDDKQPTIQVSELNQKLESAMGTPSKQKTATQQEREAKKQERYWNSMITRKEAFQMVDRAVQAEEEKLRLIFIQAKTLTNFLVSKGLCTLEELDELSKPIVEEIYGKPPEQSNTEESEK